MNSWQMHNQELPDIVVSAPPLIVCLVGRPPVANADPSYARLCLAFAAAPALRKGALDIGLSPLHSAMQRRSRLGSAAGRRQPGSERTRSAANVHQVDKRKVANYENFIAV